MFSDLRTLISESVSSTTANIIDVLQDNWVTVILVILGFSALIAFTLWINPFHKRKI